MSDDEILAMADAVSVKMRVREYDENLLAFARAVERAARAAEREACAQQLDALGCDHCAGALRHRAEGDA